MDRGETVGQIILNVGRIHTLEFEDMVKHNKLEKWRHDIECYERVCILWLGLSKV